MDDETYKYAEIVAWLKEQGYSEEQVAKIIDHVEKYEDTTSFLSEMDSIDNDEFGVAAIIARALAEPGDSSPN